MLPAGGSSPVGALGCVEAALELAARVHDGTLPRPGTVVCAVGTGGTLAGTTLGLRLAGLDDVTVEGVLVNDQLPLEPARIARLARATARLLRRRGAPVPPSADLHARDIVVASDALGAGYGHPTAEGDAAVALGPALGLTLEPVYVLKTTLRETTRLARAGTRAHSARGRQDSRCGGGTDGPGLTSVPAPGRARAPRSDRRR